MRFLRKIFGQPAKEPSSVGEGDDPIVIVPIPALVSLLMGLEKIKGSPLTEEEVVTATGRAPCITMLASHRDQLAESRGFIDIDPENAWQDWQAARAVILGEDTA